MKGSPYKKMVEFTKKLWDARARDGVDESDQFRRFVNVPNFGAR